LLQRPGVIDSAEAEMMMMMTEEEQGRGRDLINRN
jgi:hypothetical protein